MRLSTRRAPALYLPITLITTICLAPVAWCRGDDPSEAKEFDSPSPTDYRREYDRDADNQRKQTWDQYWGWVKSFHEGTFFCSGWTDRAKDLVDGVKPGPERTKLVKEINSFGQDICKEWAKDSSICKVGTGDLTRWGKIVEKAKKLDAGDGEELGRAIATIREEYKKKVKPPPPAEDEVTE